MVINNKILLFHYQIMLSFFIKYSYLLALYLFIFIFIFIKNLPIEFLNVWIVLYIILLFPLQKYIWNYFKNIKETRSIKTIFFDVRLYIFFIIISVAYYFSPNIIISWILFSYFISLFFIINFYTLSIAALILFWFFLFYFFIWENYFSSVCLLFSFYYMLSWIVFYVWENYFWKISCLKKYSKQFFIIICILFYIFFSVSFYNTSVNDSILYIFLGLLILFNLSWKDTSIIDKLHSKSEKILWLFLIVFLFIIIFIPIIDIHLVWAEKNNLFIITLWLFILFFTFFYTIINKISSK